MLEMRQPDIQGRQAAAAAAAAGLTCTPTVTFIAKSFECVLLTVKTHALMIIL